MYTIYLAVHPNGWPQLKKPVYSSRNIVDVKEEIKRLVMSGTPLEELSIAEEIEFDFKCAVSLHGYDTAKEEV